MYISIKESFIFVYRKLPSGPVWDILLQLIIYISFITLQLWMKQLNGLKCSVYTFNNIRFAFCLNCRQMDDIFCFCQAICNIYSCQLKVLNRFNNITLPVFAFHIKNCKIFENINIKQVLDACGCGLSYMYILL